VKENDNNSSNYILTASNNLINKVRENDENSSNYILTASNNLINKVRENDENSSNYILTASNNLINKVRENDENSSNYILTTSNLISKRITDLTTDMITENSSAINKFIVNNSYNNNLEVNGTLTINSNLIVLGDTTRLDTVAYTTERLEVVNTNNTTTAFMVQQNSTDRDIFVASNMNTAVFKVANNGDVLITGAGVYKRNDRDVIWDTSNYILTASNNLINKVRENDENSSNYILTASNNLINKIKENDNNSSNYILTASNNLINKVKENDENSSNYILTASNNLINKVRENDNNSSNYILTTSNNLINKVNANDNNASNYILTINNDLIHRINTNDGNVGESVLSTSNILAQRINKYSVWEPVGTNIYYYSTGNVGIGTTNPSTDLHIYDNLINETKLTIQNNYSVAASGLPTEISVVGATGSIIDATEDRYIMFPYSGTGATSDYTFTTTEALNADILVVGGGGGGGARHAGGGGAGTLMYHKNIILNGTYNIKVGKGGAGNTSGILNGGNASDGNFSQFIRSDGTQHYYAVGGGRGTGGGFSYANTNGGQGMLYDPNLTLSSGNIFNSALVAVLNKGYVNTLPSPEGCRGNIGGIQVSNFKGGGGGGAGGVGMNHDIEASVNDGYGGLGLAVDITGTPVVYAGGGNGCDFYGSVSQVFDPTYNTIQLRGGGGYGSDYGTPQAGLDGTGGGGGGQGDDNYGGGKGGSGIVIIRYRKLLSASASASIELIRGTTTDANNDWKLGNYAGDFKIMSSVSSVDTNRLLLTPEGDITVSGSVNAKSYLLGGSNILIKIDETSNYILTTSNILSQRLYNLDQLTSNIIGNSISILNSKVANNDDITSNFVISTSNIISKRITDLTTDMIAEKGDANNKFIVNNRYNNNLELNGTLTINSNLIVLGDTTRLDTIVYTTERLEVVNANNTTTAFMVQQNSTDRDIFVASNMNTAVFRVANNGDVLITGAGVYKKNNRDVIWDTSNYILTASNNLINKIRENDNNSSNYTLTASNNLINKIRENDNNSSNYTLTASNNLINKVSENDRNSSNYILNTSNILIQNININDINVTAKIALISNTLIAIGILNDNNASNYILTASNNLINKVRENDNNSSNYILTASNNLINKVRENDNNASNYILTASNNLINKVRENDNNASNYILTASNNLINKVRENDNNTSNYILTTSNLISKRITDLTTDMITEKSIAVNKFIVNNRYNNNLEVNGNLTVNSNLIVLGDTTRLDTVAYTTERLEVVNANNTTTAFMVQQNSADRDIFVASNMSSVVFRVANDGDVFTNGDIGIGTTQPRSRLDVIGNMTINGDVIPGNDSIYNLGSTSNKWKDLYLSGNSIFLNNTVLSSDEGANLSITDETGSFKDINMKTIELTGDAHIIGNGIFKRNNRDVFWDTSNYILTASNNLINKVRENDNNSSNYILTASNNLINKVKENDNNSSNYILTASNNLINKVRENDNNSSNYILTASNNLINKVRENDNNSSNYILTASNNLINKVKENDNNSSNYILTASNNLINKVKENDDNSSNYILTASNLISKRITDLTTDMITEKSSAINKFIVNNRYNNNLEVNGTLTINSNLIVLGDTTRLDTIVYTTERLEVVNANNTTTAFMVQQNSADRDIFVASNMTTSVFRIANNGDVLINGAGVYKKNNRDVIWDTSNYILTASNNLINKVRENDNNSSNYILTTSNNLINKVRENDNNSSNYILTTSNNLINKVRENDNNASNYILTASNNLINKVRENDNNASNYILTASNNLINKVRENDNNSSNYILTASNNLINKIRENDNNSSNYILTASNNLINKIRENDNNSSNYILITSNILSQRLYNLDQLTSNIVSNSISILNSKVTNNDDITSNLVLSTSNIISKRITDLTTDMINENTNGSKKFIVNNRYNNNLEVNGTLTINSNLIVLGDTTRLDTIVYTTERLEVVNANNTTTAFMVQQNSADRDIFVASNMSTAVFRVANNGDVLITGAGVYKKNNRDVIWDTSNYILTASNNLINKIRENDNNSSNYILTASNNLINKIRENDNNASNYILTASNNLIRRVNADDNNSSNYTLTASNNLINKIRENDNNSSNYTLTASNNLINKIRENDNNSSNYILTASNNLIRRVNADDNNSSNYTLTASNNLINKIRENDNNSSNYILTASNNLINKIRENDNNSSNYILTASNNLIRRVNTDDNNSSNYTLTASNNLINKIRENDDNTSAKITVLTNTLLLIDATNDDNMSNYVLSASNLISKRITDLTTDMITERSNAVNKFIVNNRYNNNLEVNGNLTVNSNLIILGDSTRLDTTVYTTERLEVVNANNTTTAFMVQQNSANRDIFVASNMSTAVFRIANNGDVNMNGVMTIKGDIIPSSNVAYNLGSVANRWKDLYLSGDSIYLNNTVLSSDSGSDLNIKDTSGTYKNININTLQLNRSGKQITLGIDETGRLTYTNASNVTSFAITTTSVASANLDTSILNVDKGGTGVGTLASGQLLIGNGTGNVLQTSNLRWDNTNKRLGIGTSAPENILHISDASTSNTKLTIQNSFVGSGSGSLPTEIVVAGAISSNIGINERYIMFPYSGTATSNSFTFTTTQNLICDILLVGGGGGGGYSYIGGGGGAGGYVYTSNVNMTAGNYTVNVGAGGKDASSTTGWFGGNGGNSSITGGINYTALGGGGGAGGSSLGGVYIGKGNNGGSGGGGSISSVAGGGGNSSGNGGTSIQFTTYGYGSGGDGTTYTPTANAQIRPNRGGNGGGASGIPSDVSGGDGLANSITGTLVTYAGGGGGGNDANNVKIPGGIGGGGAGSEGTGLPAIAGADGFGGGGGGARGWSSGPSAKGGSGIVIIRYRTYLTGSASSSSASIELIRGSPADSNTDYKIGNYEGEFKIMSSTSNVDISRLHINSSGNVGIGTSAPIANLHITDASINNTKLTIQNTFLSNGSNSKLPNQINVVGAISTNIGAFDRCIIFPYSLDNTGIGQTLYTITTTENLLCDILIVGGGGGGSAGHGGGGGAGQLVLMYQATLNSGTYTIKVGKGGNKTVASSSTYTVVTHATKGADSSFETVVAEGGGANGANISDKNGGSGAGGDAYGGDGGTSGAGNKNTTVDTFPGATVYSRGNNGGNNLDSGTGGGGGGAGQIGINGTNSSPHGKGGNGLSGISEINYDFKSSFGTTVGKIEGDGLVWFAGGGGGGGDFNTSGGLGGGGGGKTGYTNAGNNGDDGTGSGGGGGSGYSGNGGNGGSGIVIIKYRKAILPSSSSIIELIQGTSADSNTDYKLGNYSGDFKIMTSTSNVDINSLLISANGEMTLSSNLLIQSRIGIGTTSPSSKLEVYGGDIRLNTNWIAGATMNVLGINTDRRLEFSFNNGTSLYDTNKIRFLTGTSLLERMVIDTSGNVGIGGNTTVGGSSTVSGSATIAGNMNVAGTILFNMNWTGGVIANLMAYNADKRLEFSFDNGTALYDNNKLRFFTGPGVQPFPRMTIATNGNVGIGTITPSQRVHIVHPSNGLVRIETDTSAISQVSGIEFGIPSYSSATRSKITSTSYTGDASDLQFYTSASTSSSATRMTIATSGNVGIGTATPSQRVHIVHPSNGLVRIETDTSAASQVSGIEFGIPSYSSATRSKITSTTYTGDGSDLQFYTSSSTSSSTARMMITSNGFIGIGTATPSQRLHVVHPSNNLVRIETNSNAISQVSGIEFGIPSYSSAIRSKITSTTYAGDASDLQFYTSSGASATTRMMITSNGNVGIGTSPENKLHIYDTIAPNTKMTIQNSYVIPTLPTEIVVPGSISSNIGITDRYIIFPYTSDSPGLTGQTQYSFTTSGNLLCDILIIGGGGGGGMGGGGGGGYVYMSNVNMTSSNYTVRVGNGGSGIGTYYSNGSQGYHSSISGGSINNIIAYGGGGGGGAFAPSHTTGQVGSYGGQGADTTTKQTYTSTQGNIGGTSIYGFYGSGGGGGGAGSIGSDSVFVDGIYAGGNYVYNRGGQGGNGKMNDITGTVVNYAGGGTGGASTDYGTDSSPKIPPLGGGGIGSRAPGENGGNGTNGLGGGGGGGDHQRSSGGNGGSGIVIIRYRNTVAFVLAALTPAETSASIELTRGLPGDANTDYKIGNFNGDFKIMSSTSNVDINRLLLTSNGDITVSGSIEAPKYLLGGRNILEDTSNYVLSTNNIISERIFHLNNDIVAMNTNTATNIIRDTSAKVSLLCNTMLAIGNLNSRSLHNTVNNFTDNTTSKFTMLCNTMLAIGKANDNNISNYIFATSNKILSAINANSAINATANNLEVNGNLTVNSNLIVLGDSTRLETTVYTTERMEIVNANNTTTALMVQQNTANRDIFVASNMSTRVFNIANNGDVNMNGSLTATNITGALNMANATSGTLAVARGGTGATTLTAGQVLIGNTTSALQTANLTWDIANSRLGIGTATPIRQLHVVGEIIATDNIISYYSDERLKTKIGDINEPLKIINKLNGFYYIPNELARINGITNTDKEIGLSAQDVQRVLPEIVNIAPFDLATDEEGRKISKSGENYLTMSYERLAPVFVEAIKELEQKNTVLEQKNKDLSEKYNTLLEDITIIKKTLSSIKPQ
jgi:hypothetical protein